MLSFLVVHKITIRTMINDQLLNKGIKLLHAQPFYDEQYFALKPTDDHTVRKGILLLHAQPFYAQQDFPLKLTDNHILLKWKSHRPPHPVNAQKPCAER